MVHRFGLDLLGGHVADGPDDGALPGPGFGRGGSVRGLLIRDVPFREFGQPEVQHLRKAVLGDHDVPRLQVPVDDPGRVGFGQPLGRLGEIAEQRPKVGLLVMNFRGQRFPADQLHRNEVDRARSGFGRCFPLTRANGVLPDLVDRNDVGVAERRSRLGLQDESPDPFLVPDQVRRQDFQRDVPLEAEVLGEIHLTHPARAERTHDAIVGDVGSWLQRSTHWGLPPTLSR